jgi:hypothetical protein
MTGDGPWWVVIDLHLPYSGRVIREEPGEIAIPFATGGSAEKAAREIRVSVRYVPAVIQGAVIEDRPAISPGSEPPREQEP